MSGPQSPDGRTPVLLDTDIGGDIDDANALAYLIASPEVDLVGVTTVGAGGSARRRAEVAAHLLEVGGRGNVAVSAGFDQPLLENAVLRALSAEHILNAHEPAMASTAVSEVHAVDRIVSAVERYRGDLALVCIGCLTNVAGAVREAPDLMRQVGRVVAMIGAFSLQMREANAAIDPEAADIVLRSGLPLRLLGYEVASLIRLPLSVYAEGSFQASPLGAALGRMAQRYAAAYETDSMTLYDVMPAVAATHPELFAFDELRVAVELRGTISRGMTIVETDPIFNAVPNGTMTSVARSVQVEAVERLFRERVLAGSWS